METKLTHFPRTAAGKTSVKFKSGTGPSPKAYAASYTSNVITAKIRKPPVKPSETAIFCVCNKMQMIRANSTDTGKHRENNEKKKKKREKKEKYLARRFNLCPGFWAGRGNG